MRKTAFLVVLSFLLLSCSDVPTQAPQKAAVDTPDSPTSQATAEVPNSLGKNVNWDVHRYSWKGDQARAWWYDNGVQGYVYVSRDQGSSTAWLWYYVYVDGNQVQHGYGTIPSSDVSGSYGSGWMRLDTNTSAESNPGFYRGAGSGGKITVTWRKTGEWQSDNGGYYAEMYNNPKSGYAHDGRNHDESARASGSVVGYSVASPGWPGNQTIGRHRGMHVWFYLGD